MTVHRHSETQYKLSCDGQGCANHYIVDTSREQLKKADDWLQRHGWRTIEGEIHYCKFCANKLEVFHPQESKQGRSV